MEAKQKRNLFSISHQQAYAQLPLGRMALVHVGVALEDKCHSHIIPSPLPFPRILLLSMMLSDL